MFSLMKLAYKVCDEEEKDFFDNDLETFSVDEQSCCTDALDYLKRQNNSGICEFGPEPWTVRFWTETAALHGHKDCLEYAVGRGFPLTAGVCANASAGGRLEFLRYVRELGCPWDERVRVYAAIGGHTECLRFAHESGFSLDDRSLAVKAAAGGHIECLAYLLDNGCEVDSTACDVAASNGRLDCLMLLLQHGCTWDRPSDLTP